MVKFRNELLTVKSIIATIVEPLLKIEFLSNTRGYSLRVQDRLITVTDTRVSNKLIKVL